MEIYSCRKCCDINAFTIFRVLLGLYDYKTKSWKDELMKELKSLGLVSVFFLSSLNAFSYDVVDRFKIIDDKLKTEQMLRPIGHDFFLDIGVALNKNLTDVVKDISDTGKSTSDAATKLAEAQQVLTKYDKTEQTIKINVALGFPVFRFSAWDLKVQPNVRAFVDAGANIGIRSDILTAQDILNLFPTGITNSPADAAAFKNFLSGLTTGQDIITQCASSSLSAATKAACATQPTGKYIMPDLTAGVPNISLFAKLDAKVGLFNDYTYGEHFFGNFNLYGLSRTDVFQRITENMIATGSKIELPTQKNTETTLQADYRLGYKNDNYKVFASVEELKLAKMTDHKVGSKDQSYGYDPLMRIHADAIYKFSVVSLNPFLGVHKRTGYGFADGMYLGADAGAHVWGDRLGIQLRGMVDKQYFTISPRLKLWLLQLEYSLKNPIKATDGDVKLSAIHSIDLRLFF